MGQGAVPPRSLHPPGRREEPQLPQLPVSHFLFRVRPSASGAVLSRACVAMEATSGLSLAGRVRAAVARCGFATRGLASPGRTGREPDPDSDWEPEERELQEVERYGLLPGPSA